MKNNLAFVLSVVSLIGILYVAYYQQVYMPRKIKRCFDVAVALERARHAPVDDLEVTNQDISSFMKNTLACVVD